MAEYGSGRVWQWPSMAVAEYGSGRVWRWPSREEGKTSACRTHVSSRSFQACVVPRNTSQIQDKNRLPAVYSLFCNCVYYY